MMRSMFSAVSGLKAHQTKMDVIGNNIANVNTVSYKAQGVTFSDVYYQTTQSASGPNDTTGKGGTNAKQIGLGSSVASISTSITSQGASERTDNAWDLMISGDQFFIVSSGGDTNFTRAGNFTIDDNGALVTAAGANVMGWVTSPTTGEIVKDKVQALYPQSSEYTYTAPEATTGVTITGNINSADTVASNFTFTFYDTLGNSYQVSASLSAPSVSTDGTTATCTITGGTVTQNGVETGLTCTFDSGLTFNYADGTCTTTSPVGITFEAPSTGATANETAAENNIKLTQVDFSSVTLRAASTDFNNSYGITVDGVTTGKGKGVGTMSSLGVDESGQIIASYSNGDTKVIAQIAVTSFTNPAGLEKVGENLYAATLNSGQFNGIGEDISASGGKMSSGYLEMSNVDLADQFTSMITTQRGFQANSRIITVSDTLLEELINLKR